MQALSSDRSADIQRNLEQIDSTVESLKIWVANTIAQGKLDKDKLDQLMKK